MAARHPIYIHLNPAQGRDVKAIERDGKMKKLIIASALLGALCVPALADPGNGNGYGQGDGGGRDHKYSGVPGPLVGAGLPFLAVGYGVYWLVRRRRRAN
jgi:hypothetical protein